MLGLINRKKKKPQRFVYFIWIEYNNNDHWPKHEFSNKKGGGVQE